MTDDRDTETPRIGVLFVCHGNLCRSPLAEGIFKHLVVERGLEGHFVVDSAGTYAMAGNLPHPLSVEVAQEHGISLASVSRGLEPEDLQRFDHIVVMDRENHIDVTRLAETARIHTRTSAPQIRFLRQTANPLAAGADLDVPDPIVGGVPEYRLAFELIDEGCRALLDELSTEG